MPMRGEVPTIRAVTLGDRHVCSSANAKCPNFRSHTVSGTLSRCVVKLLVSGQGEASSKRKDARGHDGEARVSGGDAGGKRGQAGEQGPTLVVRTVWLLRLHSGRSPRRCRTRAPRTASSAPPPSATAVSGRCRCRSEGPGSPPDRISLRSHAARQDGRLRVQAMARMRITLWTPSSGIMPKRMTAGSSDLTPVPSTITASTRW